MLSRLLSAWCGFWAGALATIFFLAFVLSLSGCTAGRRVAEQAPPEQAAPDSLAGQVATPQLGQLASLPAYLVPPPVGSSPRQRRQWQRAQARNLARAGVLPAKVKNGSVATAPGAVALNRLSAPMALGDRATASDARKAGQRGGGGVATAPQAAASGATLVRNGPPWWVYVLLLTLGFALGWKVFRA